MRASVARIKHPVLEVMTFKVGQATYGVELGQVVGLVKDLPAEGSPDDWGDTDRVLFRGRDVPVFPAADFLADAVTPGRKTREAILFDDGAGIYGMVVDRTGTVVEVTPGDDLYTFPPQMVTDSAPCRPWGLLTLQDHPVILLDMNSVTVH